MGIRTPRLVALDLDPEIARYEADEEVQDLITASPGLNLGIDFLPGAFGYDGTLPAADAAVGARVLWLDAFLANVDRTWRNPNLLVWHDELWAIDHGASLYFHHAWAGGVTDPARFATQAWDPAGHVMLRWADRLTEVDAEVTPRLDRDAVTAVVAEVPDAWLPPASGRRRPRPAAHGVRRLPARPARDPAVAARCGGGMTASTGHPYQYVVLRCVPRVDREEFLNVGVVLYAEESGFLAAAWHVDPDRLRSLDPRVDLDQVCEALTFVDGVCAGDDRAGAAGEQPLGTRFGFLKAPRSTVLQPGPVHGGLTTDPARQLEHLLERLVG